MSPRITLNPIEREKLGALINNVSVLGQQLIARTGADFSNRALNNLETIKQEEEKLLIRLDTFAREHQEESPLRLLEDLRRVPADLAQMLTMVRRCHSVCIFLGHLLAQPMHLRLASDTSPRDKTR